MFTLLSREFSIGYDDVLKLPDEVFHLYVEKVFTLLSKQIGMSTYGYDFRSEDEKALDKFLNTSNGEDE